ncbi:MAG: hypothetical protein R2788_20955 [Saprospiraceae bacterium]
MEAERGFKNGEGNPTLQARFYISRAESAEYFCGMYPQALVPLKPAILALDVVFNEDRQRLREGNGPENMAIVRKMASANFDEEQGRKSFSS